MTLKECYDALEGDFEGILSRLPSEKLVEKFALKFLADESFSALEKALGERDYEEAFRAAHTLKGVSANLSFTRLCDAVSGLTEQLRGGRQPADGYFTEAVRAAYEQTVKALERLQEE